MSNIPAIFNPIHLRSGIKFRSLRCYLLSVIEKSWIYQIILNTSLNKRESLIIKLSKQYLDKVAMKELIDDYSNGIQLARMEF